MTAASPNVHPHGSGRSAHAHRPERRVARPGVQRASTWVAWTMAGCAIVATGLSLVILVVLNAGRSPLPAIFATPGGAFSVWPALLGSAIAVVAALLGGLVAARRPANPVGWLLCTGALLASGFYLTYQYAVAAWLSGYDTLQGATAAAWLAESLWVAAFGLIMSLFLVFPDGRLPSRRWRPAAGFVVGGFAALTALTALTPGQLGAFPVVNPVGVAGLEPLGARTALVWPLLAGIAVASVLARFRSARSIERQQIKLLVTPAVLLPVAVIVYQLRILPWPTPVVLLLMAGIAVPLAIGQGVLRYRLYDIDRVISRTVGYGLLSGLLLGTYLVAVITLQAVLRPWAGNSQIAVAGATLAAVTVFHPARRRIQAAVDRRFNRARYDAQRTVAAFQSSLRHDTGLAELVAHLNGVVRATVEPTRASVQLGPPQVPAATGARPAGPAPRASRPARGG